LDGAELNFLTWQWRGDQLFAKVTAKQIIDLRDTEKSGNLGITEFNNDDDDDDDDNNDNNDNYDSNDNNNNDNNNNNNNNLSLSY